VILTHALDLRYLPVNPPLPRKKEREEEKKRSNDFNHYYENKAE